MENKTDAYFKVRIKTLIPGKPLSFDLFIRLQDNPLLYLRAGDILTPEKIAKLSKQDSGAHFYINESDRGHFRNFIHDQMNSTTLDVEGKALLLRESSMNIVEELFENSDVHAALAGARPVIQQFVEFMDAEPKAMGHLISLSGHDFYTYNHSLDVGIYSMGLGAALGYDLKTLEELGIASLFHDIGKRQVSLEILCKKGPLSPEEWTQMQKHPQFGFVILNENPTISAEIKAACFEHHESWAGNGYPQQLVADEIHPFARIVAITDTYDAMTTQRSYNVPLKPFDAVTMMKEKLAGRYDPEMLKAMHSVLFKLGAA